MNTAIARMIADQIRALMDAHAAAMSAMEEQMKQKACEMEQKIARAEEMKYVFGHHDNGSDEDATARVLKSIVEDGVGPVVAKARTARRRQKRGK